jgi:hypothetical protein
MQSKAGQGKKRPEEKQGPNAQGKAHVKMRKSRPKTRQGLKAKKGMALQGPRYCVARGEAQSKIWPKAKAREVARQAMGKARQRKAQGKVQ